MELFYQYVIVIFLNLSPIISDLYTLQVVNCDSNSRYAVDKNDNDNSDLMILFYNDTVYAYIISDTFNLEHNVMLLNILLDYNMLGIISIDIVPH